LLNAYVQEVLKFRKVLNLSSIADEQVFWDRFIYPSISLADWIPDHGRMLDIGSGMGVPGIPLLIVKPELIGVLVERRKKRAEFLRHIIRKLKLNAEVYDADICSLPSLHVDVCVARAVTDEQSLLEMCLRHVVPGAIAVLPVPRQHKVAGVVGWKMSGEYLIDAGNSSENMQSVCCYQYG